MGCSSISISWLPVRVNVPAARQVRPSRSTVRLRRHQATADTMPPARKKAPQVRAGQDASSSWVELIGGKMMKNSPARVPAVDANRRATRRGRWPLDTGQDRQSVEYGIEVLW